MSRPKPIMLLIFLCVVIVAFGGIALSRGVFLIAKHEGDTLHLLQIVFRMAEGDLPHVDFMTPIGILAFWPIVLFLEMGQGVGQAIISGQVLVAIVLAIPTFWIAMTRFDGPLAYGFALVVMVLVLALVHGDTDRLVSISMHYNRWAWAVAYLAIAAAVLPALDGRGARVDGVVVGLCMAALALTKVTYFIAFAPGVLVALIVRQAWMSLGVAALSGIAVVLAMTAFAGTEFWLAYVNDLRTVASTDVRPAPGATLRAIVGAPEFLGGTLILFGSVILLRQGGQSVVGLALLVLAPGFIYVTYQNFGNDPQWMMLLAIILLWAKIPQDAKNGFGWPIGRAVTPVAVAALAMGSGSFFNLAYSPFRHAGFNEADYQPIIPRLEAHADLKVRVVRANRMDAHQPQDGPGSGFEHLHEIAKRDNEATEFQGELWPQCELQLGLIVWFEELMQELDETGLASGKRIFAADIFSSHWLFGDVERLEGGAPWYYGGLSGFDSADLLIVPLCPSSVDMRKLVLQEIEDAGVEVEEIYRGRMFVLYDIKT